VMNIRTSSFVHPVQDMDSNSVQLLEKLLQIS